MRAVNIWLAVVAILGFAGSVTWASDAITLQGERTVYTAECRDGQWQGPMCTGKLVAAQRYRFRALRSHNEVVFWTVGAIGEPSGKYTDCRIIDGRNWFCPANADARLTITLQFVRGDPIPGPEDKTKPYHAVAKWRWWLSRLGVPIGSEANN
jgi:hypothetical protein